MLENYTKPQNLAKHTGKEMRKEDELSLHTSLAPDLSIIIPTHNGAGHIERITDEILELRRLQIRLQIIFVDDGSTDDSPAILESLEKKHPEILHIATKGNLGAGLARNTGWRQAKGKYTIFFDVDDHFHPESVPLCLQHLEDLPTVDTAIFSYRYEREETANFTGMNHHDEKLLRKYLKGKEFAVGKLDEMGPLIGLTNYPWNKILRTSRFKEKGLKFGSTKVHNDILGHWHTLLFSREIALLDRVICTHVVHPNGKNLTNRFGEERFQMFDALSELYDLLENNPALRHRYSHHYWALCDQLMNWVRPRISNHLNSELNERYRTLLSRINLDDLSRMKLGHSPNLAETIIQKILT